MPQGHRDGQFGGTVTLGHCMASHVCGCRYKCTGNPPSRQEGAPGPLLPEPPWASRWRLSRSGASVSPGTGPRPPAHRAVVETGTHKSPSKWELGRTLSHNNPSPRRGVKLHKCARRGQSPIGGFLPSPLQTGGRKTRPRNMSQQSRLWS